MQLGRFAFFMPVNISPVTAHCRQKDADTPEDAEPFGPEVERRFDQRQQALSKGQYRAQDGTPSQQQRDECPAGDVHAPSDNASRYQRMATLGSTRSEDMASTDFGRFKVSRI